MKACVLLSSYNGAPYLAQQIESVLSQSLKEIVLLIRDDGSCDSSVEICREYAERDDVLLIEGENVGVVGSFFELLRQAPDADIYAFCDQDDWWFPHKLERAWQMLQSAQDQPKGVVCRLAITDTNLDDQFTSKAPPRGYSFANALIENVVVGCGLSFNRQARCLMLDHPPNTLAVVMHDWWAYLVLSAMGGLQFDSIPGVKYRQHGRNVVGARTGLAQFKSRVMRLASGKSKGLIRQQAAEFRKCFGSFLDGEDRKMLDGLLHILEHEGFFARLLALTKVGVRRQKALDTFIFYGLVLSGRV